MPIQIVYSNPNPPSSKKLKPAPAINAKREQQALKLLKEGYNAFWDCPEVDQTVNRAVFIAKLRLFVEQGYLNE